MYLRISSTYRLNTYFLSFTLLFFFYTPSFLSYSSFPFIPHTQILTQADVEYFRNLSSGNQVISPSNPNSKNSLLSELEKKENFPKENNTSILGGSSNNIYDEFEHYVLNRVQTEKEKIRSNIDLIKKTSSWNKERTLLFQDYLEKTLNSGDHIFSEK